MNQKRVWLLLLVVTGMFTVVTLCWAKENCYNYMVAYSYRDKTVYHSPIFINKTKGVSYNEEEYVSDTATSIKMEKAFHKHLATKMQVNSVDLTISARVAYKTDDIAKNHMDKEIGDFRFKGFTIKEVNGFNLDN